MNRQTQNIETTQQLTTLSPNGGSVSYSILDACCGSRMMWFNHSNPNTVYVDKRCETWKSNLTGRNDWIIRPDILCDFTALPFRTDSFQMVVFDPPHFKSLGENSHMAKKYGRLIGDWETIIHGGFDECWRVLKPNGTLIFKWNSTEVPLSKILKLAPDKPLFGHTTGRKAKTHWLAFMKPNNSGEPRRENDEKQ